MAKRMDPKTEALRLRGSLNPHPERVHDERFSCFSSISRLETLTSFLAKRLNKERSESSGFSEDRSTPG